MSVATEGGLSNDGFAKKYVCTTAVPSPGYLVKAGSGAGIVDLCGAGERPVGIAYGDTVDPITETATAAEKVAIAALRDGDIWYIPLLATNAAISAWDELETVAGGKVDLKSGAGEIVGYAEEAKAQNAGGYIRVRIQRRIATS